MANWHRWYDPKRGRYLTQDSLGEIGAYPYARANPIGYVDLNGAVASPVPTTQQTPGNGGSTPGPYTCDMCIWGNSFLGPPPGWCETYCGDMIIFEEGGDAGTGEPSGGTLPPPEQEDSSQETETDPLDGSSEDYSTESADSWKWQCYEFCFFQLAMDAVPVEGTVVSGWVYGRLWVAMWGWGGAALLFCGGAVAGGYAVLKSQKFGECWAGRCQEGPPIK